MKAVVVGSGGWGTALSMVLCDNGHDVTLWSHDPAKAAQMAESRENSKLKGVRLPDALHIGGDLDCLIGAELVVCAAPSFAVRETGKKITTRVSGPPKVRKKFVSPALPLPWFRTSSRKMYLETITAPLKQPQKYANTAVRSSKSGKGIIPF